MEKSLQERDLGADESVSEEVKIDDENTDSDMADVDTTNPASTTDYDTTDPDITDKDSSALDEMDQEDTHMQSVEGERTEVNILSSPLKKKLKTVSRILDFDQQQGIASASASTASFAVTDEQPNPLNIAPDPTKAGEFQHLIRFPSNQPEENREQFDMNDVDPFEVYDIICNNDTLN